MSGILCLKWNNHNSTFLQTLDCLRKKELYCDATLACCGNYYPVHRFVLTTCSDYFEEIFSRTPCKHPFIILKDVDDMQLEALLNYMYKGEVNVLQESLPSLIRAAETLKVKGLAVSDEEVHTKKPEKKSHHFSRTSQPRSSEKTRPSSSVSEESEASVSSKETAVEEPVTETLPPPQLSLPPPPTPTPPICDSIQIPECAQDENADDCSASLGSANNEDASIFSSQATSHVNEIGLETFDDVKREPEEAIEPLEEKFHVGLTSEKDSHSFMSLLDPNMFADKDLPDQSAAINGFPIIPQCSTWSDTLTSADVKEMVPSSWLQSDYDGFAVDPLQMDANETHSPTSAILDESLPILKEGRRYKNKRGEDGSFPKKKSKYVCHDCSFSTNDKAAFRLHMMRKHTGEKPFACSICSYRCTTKDMLKIHTRKHTGERPFSCPYCTCRMAVKSSLKRHILLKHIQARKPRGLNTFVASDLGTLKTYKCTDCSYESQMKSNLKLHYMRIHTGEKPIACSICPYRTTTKPQLEKHMRKHTGEKPFMCTFCSYKAAQKHSLLRHMASHTK